MVLSFGTFAGVAAAGESIDFLMGLELTVAPGWGQVADPEDPGDPAPGQPAKDDKPLLGPGIVPPVDVPSVPGLDPFLPGAPAPPEPNTPLLEGGVDVGLGPGQDSDVDVTIHSSVAADLQSILDLLGMDHPQLPKPLRDVMDDPTRWDFSSDIGSSLDIPELPDPANPRAPDSPVRRVSFGMRFQDFAVDGCVGPDCPVPLEAAPPSAASDGPGVAAGVLGERETTLPDGLGLAALDDVAVASGPAASPGGPASAAAVAPGASYPAQSTFITSAPDLLVLTVLALGALLPAGFALYSRLRRDDALENATRLRIYQSVSVNPGLSIQELARRAATSHSTAAYHLERLTRAKMVVPTHDGNKVRFYPNGGRFNEQERRLLPCLENAETTRVLETVLQRPWTYRAELAAELGVTATTVSWHLKRIIACGVVVEVREGRNAHLFVERNALRGLCAGLRVKVPATSPVCEVAERLLAQLGAPALEPRATQAGPVPVPLPVFAEPPHAPLAAAQPAALRVVPRPPPAPVA